MPHLGRYSDADVLIGFIVIFHKDYLPEYYTVSSHTKLLPADCSTKYFSNMPINNHHINCFNPQNPDKIHFQF